MGCWLLFALAGCAADKEAIRREAQSSYKMGIAYLREGRTPMALQELAKAEKLTPDDPEVANALGLGYWDRREYGAAEEKFRKATQLKPDYSEAWNNLGAMYLDLGKYDAAVPALENALKNVFYTTQERALANLGWALFKAGRTAEAEKRLREAIEVDSTFPLAHKFLGMLLQERGEHREALTQFNESLRVNPNDAETNLKKGVSLVKLGEREAAREAFDRAWRLSPGTDVGKSAKNYLDFLQ